MLTCFQKLIELHSICCFQTNEGARVGPASKSELRRWFKANCVEVNFEPVAADDPWPLVLKSLVLFPNNKKKRTTLFYDDGFTLIRVLEINTNS